MKDPTIRLALLAALAGLGLGGCTYSSSSPSAPAQGTTIVVPPGSTAVCANGTAPPC